MAVEINAVPALWCGQSCLRRVRGTITRLARGRPGGRPSF